MNLLGTKQNTQTHLTVRNVHWNDDITRHTNNNSQISKQLTNACKPVLQTHLLICGEH